MNDTELDELLDKWSAPVAPESLREGVTAGFRPQPERRKFRWSWGKSLMAAAMAAMLLVIVTQAVPQTLPPEVHHPYVVLSEFSRYAKDGSAEVKMYSTSYNDEYGREIILARHLADNPVGDVVARTLDALADATAPIRFRLARLSPQGAEMLARQAAIGSIPSVNTECAEKTCMHGTAHYFLPKAAANPGIGCVDGPVVDRETILDYPTVAIQLPLDGNRVRRTVWMAPALGCFALKVSTERQREDGSFRLVSGKQAVKVRLNP
jgi:hypothetical protein